MRWVIFVIMFMFDPLHVGNDAITVDFKNGEPLLFHDVDECVEHVQNNLEEIKQFAIAEFEYKGAIKSISCVPEKLELNV